MVPHLQQWWVAGDHFHPFGFFVIFRLDVRILRRHIFGSPACLFPSSCERRTNKNAHTPLVLGCLHPVQQCPSPRVLVLVFLLKKGEWVCTPPIFGMSSSIVVCPRYLGIAQRTFSRLPLCLLLLLQEEQRVRSKASAMAHMCTI